MKENEHINLKVSLGALGEIELLVFPNTMKKPQTSQPDVSVSVKQLDRLVKCGVGWVNVKKNTECPTIEKEVNPQ